MSRDYSTVEIVNQLFQRLLAINPAFKQAWPTEEEFKATKKEWVLAFQEANINTIEHLKKGLAKVRLNPSPFIPSPGEFIAMCKPEPEDVGAPSIDKAYREACEKSHPSYGSEKNWTHEAIEYAWRKTRAWELRENSHKESVKNSFKDYYREGVELCINGRNLMQVEDKGQDTAENRRKYQVYFGDRRRMRQFHSNPETVEILSYEDWLKSNPDDQC